MAEIIDISWPITVDMTTYKDRDDVLFSRYKDFPHDTARETSWSASLHTGTHIDAPAHFLPHGGTMQAYGLHQLCGTAYVISCTDVERVITRHDLHKTHIPRDTIILLQTRNSYLQPDAPFDYEFVYLDKDAASYLVDCGVRAVGIDYLGIERDQPDHGTHNTLLQSCIPIIEGVRLGHVQPGMYGLWCLPLAMPYAEAAPARAVLYT